MALARTFGLPIPYFFIPPDDPPMEPNFPGAPDAGWSYLVGLLVGSSDARKQLGVLLGKDWILKPIPIPLDDLIDDSGDRLLGVPKNSRFRAPRCWRPPSTVSSSNSLAWGVGRNLELETWPLCWSP